MLQLLAMAKRPLCVCELENQFDLSQPTVSHHLRILRDAGVVSATRRGTWVFYELNAKPLKLLRKLEKLLCGDSCECGSARKKKAEIREEEDEPGCYRLVPNAYVRLSMEQFDDDIEVKYWSVEKYDVEYTVHL